MTQIDMEKFRIGFLEEASDLLEEANESILQAEAESDLELFNAVFRSIHTIKGSAGGFGFDHMSAFAHHLETLLDKLRNGELTIDGDITDLLLRGVDALFEMVDFAREKKEYTKDLSELEKLYDNIHAGDKPVEEVSTEDEPETANGIDVADDITALLKENYNGVGKAYKVDVSFTDEMLENGYDPLTLFSNLKELSEFFLPVTDYSVIPIEGELEPYKLYLRPDIYIISDAEMSEILDLAFDSDLIEVSEINLNASAVSKPAEDSPAVAEGAPSDETIDMDGIDEEMLRELGSGIEDYFESIENHLIDIERSGEGSKEAVDNIFRVFHNIKGDCGYVGFSFLEKYSHLVENMLDKVRNDEILFDNKAAEFILSVISDVKQLVSQIMNKQHPDLPKTYKMLTGVNDKIFLNESSKAVMSEDIKIFLGQVGQFMEMIDLASDDEGGDKILARAAKGLINAAKFIGFDDLVAIAQRFESAVSRNMEHDIELSEIKRYVDNLQSPPKMLGELLIDLGKVTPEEIEEAKAEQRLIGEILVDKGKIKQNDLDVALKKQKVMKAAEVKEAPQQEQKETLTRDKVSTSMKVDQEKIDKFTNTIGELVVAKNAYEYMFQNLIRDYDLPNTLLKDFKDNSNLIARISQDLQRDILSLRMVPIKQIFNKFPRVVRDIARKQDKQIDLRIMGEETEIDKKIADILSDPLVHLIRNACDHGLEDGAERSASGKIETGHLILKAYNEGSFVYIEVIDDGRGINSDKVLKKAISKGLVEDGAQLSEKEIVQLILEPGFSTADQVTDISGRGVGMDVVKSSITSVGGIIDVSSSEGEGTRVSMKIPVTIGMSTSLLVSMEDEFYAFPIENVAETIKVDRDQVKDLHHGKGIYYRGNVLPVFQMRSLLGDEEIELEEEVSIVITVTDGGKTGIIVDKLLNRMDIAIKPVPEYFAHLNYIGGVTILGDGQAVLVLNVNKLM